MSITRTCWDNLLYHYECITHHHYNLLIILLLSLIVIIEDNVNNPLSQCYTFHFYIFNLAFFFIGCLFRLRIVDNQTLGPDTPAELATPLHLTFLNPFSYSLTFASFLHAQCSRHVFNVPNVFRFI